MSTALRRTMPAAWAHVGAMHVALEARDLRAVGEFLTVNDLVPAHGRPVVCCINGDFIARADWWQPVRCGDLVVFAEVAQGGNTGRLLGMIVVAAVSAWLPGALGFAAGSWAAIGTSIGTSVVGGLLVNALFPAQTPQQAQAQQTSPTYSVGLQGNRPRIGQAVPVRYGQELVYPDLICPDYSTFADNGRDQFYQSGLCIGLGEYNVLGIYIDDTPIQSFEDADVEIVGPGMSVRAQPTGYTGVETFADQTLIETGMVTSVEVAGQDMLTATWVGPFMAVPAGFEANQICIDVAWPRGVGTLDDDGSVDPRTISWQVQAQQIDDAGLPVGAGAWALLGSESYTASTSLPQRRSYTYTVAAGRYRVRLRRITARSDNSRHLNDMQWAQLRARLTGQGVVRTDVTGIAVRIRASAQLTALTQRRIKVYVQRLLPAWDGSTWSAPEFTRNPAWALADIWRDDVYGRGQPDDRVDLASLLEYADVWDSRQDRFDHGFDSQITTDEAAQIVAAAGRARTMLRRGAVFTVVRDEPQETAAGVLMPRNIDEESFSLRWALPTSETPDCVACTYRSGAVWSERTVYAQVHGGVIYGYTATPAGLPQRPDGVPAPALIEEVSLPGIVGEKQAQRQAAYLLARMLYRREEGSVQQDMDGLLATMGSSVGIAHDAAEWGQSGDCVDWDAGTLLLTVTEPLVWTEGATHYVRLQAHDGTLGGAIEVTPGSTDYEMVLAELPAFEPSVASPDRERTRYLFGALADVQRQAIVVSLRPTSEDTVETAFFIEDARVHQADAPWLPVGAEIQDPLSDGSIPDDGGTPGDTFVEDFELELTDNYTLEAGGWGTFDRVALGGSQALHIDSINVGTPHRIRRDMPAGLTLEELSVRFLMPAISEDDAGIMRLYAGSQQVLGFNPKRDEDFDSDERPQISMDRADSKAEHIEKRFPGGRLAADTWYELRVLVTPGDAGTSATIVRVDDNEVMSSVQVASGSKASDYSGITLTHLEWVADSGGTTTETVYDDLSIYPLEP
jgi:hypothetical protein